MGKRRTRKQKEKAKHNFLLSWESSSNEAKSGGSVKRQFKNSLKSRKGKNKTSKKAKSKAKDESLIKIRHDIVKSLGLAVLIFGLEMVIYLVWSH